MQFLGVKTNIVALGLLTGLYQEDVVDEFNDFLL